MLIKHNENNPEFQFVCVILRYWVEIDSDHISFLRWFFKIIV